MCYNWIRKGIFCLLGNFFCFSKMRRRILWFNLFLLIIDDYYAIIHQSFQNGWKSSYLVIRMKRFPNEICYPKMKHHISLIYNYLYQETFSKQNLLSLIIIFLVEPNFKYTDQKFHNVQSFHLKHIMNP